MRKKKPIVLEKIKIDDYAAEGKSLAKLNGKVVFVEGVVPGDVVDIRLNKNKKDWAEGYPIQFHTYSDERVTPFCQHFGTCGGCQWQMLPYEKQLYYKQKQVYDNLTRIGKVALPDVLPIIGAEQTRFYRNKLEYTFSTKEFTKEAPGPHPNLPPVGEGTANAQPLLNGNADVHATSSTSRALQHGAPLPSGGGRGGASVGFHAKGWFDKVVQIETCWLQGEPTNQLRNAVRRFALENEYSFYDFKQHRGLLRNLQVRICTTGEVMVNVVLGEDDEPKRVKLLNYITTTFPQITTLLYTINLKWNDSLHDQEPIVYTGKGYVVERLEDFQFKIGPKSFFQTNSYQAEKLYQVTRDFAELDGSQVIYDLYCGTGSIGIFCSKGAKKIVGVEVIGAAVEDARQNAAHNGINHAHFAAGDVVDICNDDFFATHGRPDVIITDPPRAGMHQKLVQKILDIAAPTVVYVSCNPATQARDLALLDEQYAVTKVQPVDMFPHTHHIENVVQLKLKQQDSK